MKRSLFALLLSLILFQLPAVAKYAMVIRDEDGYHLITGVSSRFYHYLHEGEPRKKGIEFSRTSLVPVNHWYPGRIHIKKLKATAYTFDMGSDQSFGLEYQIKFVPNRDIKDAYLIYYTEHPNGGKFKVAVKVGDLRKGKSKRIVSSLTVPRDFENQGFQTLFMAAGHQILTTEFDVALSTPYDKWLYEVPEAERSDGPPKPISAVKPGVVKDGNGELVKGQVIVGIKIDEAGYVVEANPVEPTTGKLVQAVLDVIYLWEFKPLIKDGKPQKCDLQVPFNF